MKKGIIFLVLGLGSSSSLATTVYTTHDSGGRPIATFTQVQAPGKFGTAWRADGVLGKPDGTMWGTDQGTFTNDPVQPDINGVIVDSPATEACAKIDGKLPTANDFVRLISYFDTDNRHLLTDQGRQDLDAVFPDGSSWSWSSTASNSNPLMAWALTSPGTVNGLIRTYTASVRCITY